MKLNVTELADLLGLKCEGVRTVIKRNKLKERLEQKGYKLIDKVKEGRKMYYIIELENENKEIYSNLCKYVYNTSKEEEFSKFFMQRAISSKYDFITTNKEIAESTKVNAKTICNWNKTLIDKKIIGKDGYYYFCITRNGNDVSNIQITEDEYKSFWRNKSMENTYNDLESKFKNDEISFKEAMQLVKDIGSIQTLLDNRYCYRINKYNLHEDNSLYIDTYNLIRSIYGNKINNVEFELIE
ncbi:MAG: hypothetical protein RSC24_06855 [Clostridium sp.]